MITLRHVYKNYSPQHVALQNIDLKIGQGDFVFVAGASGAGKSTLLKVLFGADRASSGDVIVAGRNLMNCSTNEIALVRREMGFIFQDYKLLTRRSVIDNVAFSLEVQGIKPSDRRRRAWSLLKALGLAEKADQSVLTLSGGEQQRVAVARALIHRPKILLADEPTGNLDRSMTHVIFDLLLEANAEGITIVVASHDLAIIEELNLRTLVLDKGKVLGDFENIKGIQ